MNVSLPPKMQTVNAWLKNAISELNNSNIKSASLDAELILASTLRKDRTYLHAHDNEAIPPRFLQIADARVALRKDHVPLAYILGSKDFYGRQFKVTPAVLVPRPESEQFIETLKDLMPKNESLFDSQITLVDVGTGSGVLGITAKLEFPEINVTLLDIDRHALSIAKENATRLEADVRQDTSNLLGSYYGKADFILANLPYVDKDWNSPYLLELGHEPEIALYANDDGLQFIKRIIIEAKHKLNKGGFLLIESDIRQQANIRRFARDNGYEVERTDGLITTLGFRN